MTGKFPAVVIVQGMSEDNREKKKKKSDTEIVFRLLTAFTVVYSKCCLLRPFLKCFSINERLIG